MAVTFGPSRWHFVNSFQLGEPALGGGNTICMSGGIIWIVAPASSEVSRTWYCRNDAVTTATNCTTATGWFVPTCGQLQNPGYCCRTYWDSYTSTFYWSSSASSSSTGWNVNLTNGDPYSSYNLSARFVRAFRCVTY